MVDGSVALVVPSLILDVADQYRRIVGRHCDYEVALLPPERVARLDLMIDEMRRRSFGFAD
jgi:hypothetical protein